MDQEDPPSELDDFIEGVKQSIGSLYRYVWDRPDWQRAIFGFAVFILGALASDPIESTFGLIFSVIPALGGLIPNGPLLASNRTIVVLVGVLFGHQVRRLNTLETKISSMSRAQTDGGTKPSEYQTDPFDEDDEDDTSGGGAIGGAIAGAAVGSAFGPGGTVGGAVLGAILGDSLEKSADENDDELPRR